MLFQALNDIVADQCLLTASLVFTIPAKLFEPSVVESFLPIESLVHVDVQKVTNQVFALLGDGLEFDMVEVEVSPFNLVEHVMGFVSLERQVARDQGVEYNA